jgi:hypothetical protein
MRELWICSQELWSPDHRDGPEITKLKEKIKYSYPRNRPWRPIELWDDEDPHIVNKIVSQMAVRLPALRTCRA